MRLTSVVSLLCFTIFLVEFSIAATPTPTPSCARAMLHPRSPSPTRTPSISPSPSPIAPSPSSSSSRTPSRSVMPSSSKTPGLGNLDASIISVTNVDIIADTLEVTLFLSSDTYPGFSVDVVTFLSSSQLGILFQTTASAQFNGLKYENHTVSMDISAFASVGVDLDLDISLNNLQSTIGSERLLLPDVDISVLIYGTVKLIGGALTIVEDLIGPNQLTGSVSIVDLMVTDNILNVFLELSTDVDCGFTLGVKGLFTKPEIGLKSEIASEVYFGGHRDEIVVAEIDISAFSQTSLDLYFEISLNNLLLDYALDVCVYLDIFGESHGFLDIANQELSTLESKKKIASVQENFFEEFSRSPSAASSLVITLPLAGLLFVIILL